MYKKILITIFTYIIFTVFTYGGSSEISDSATPCPPQSTYKQKPFILYFEASQETPLITDLIKADFPDSVINLACVTEGGKTLIVATIYIPAKQRDEFTSYLSSTSTAVAAEISSKRVKIINDKNDRDYREVVGDN